MWDDEKRMSFTEHLGELRDRIIRSTLAFAAAVLVCYCFSDTIFDLIAGPLRHTEIQWITLDPLEGVIMKVKMAMYGGLLLSFPYMLWHICGFIFPGLHKGERRVIQGAMAGSCLLALTGVGVAYFMIFPYVLPFLMQWVPEGVLVQLQMSKSINIIIKGFLIFGFVFQFPMVVVVLVYLGILTPEALRKHRRYAIVGLAFASAIFTPPDPMTMCLMLVPLWLLYEGSILVSYMVVWRRKKDASETDAEG